MLSQWMSDISKISSFYYDNKVFIIYLHSTGALVAQLWAAQLAEKGL